MAELVELSGAPIPFGRSADWLCLRFYGEHIGLEAPNAHARLWALEFSDYVHLLFPEGFPNGLPSSPTADALYEAATLGVPVFDRRSAVVRLAFEENREKMPVFSTGPEGSLVCRFFGVSPEGSFRTRAIAGPLRWDGDLRTSTVSGRDLLVDDATGYSPTDPRLCGWCGVMWNGPLPQVASIAEVPEVRHAMDWFRSAQRRCDERVHRPVAGYALYVQIFV